MAKRQRHDSEETTYWLSYSDMMAALLLIFVLIISFTMLQAKRQFEEKQNELAKQQELAEEQQLLVEKQQALVEEQQKIMQTQQDQLDKIIGIRSELIETLAEEFGGTELRVSVDQQTGAITFDSSVLFDSGQYTIKDSGKSFLNEFIPRYMAVLLKEEFRDYVSEIIIEGHTDTEGTYIYNLELSQQRALSVTKFCLDDNNKMLKSEQIEELRGILTANGRSFSNPIYSSDGNVNLGASRRVEFKFRLKDEEMVEEMVNILKEE